MSPADSPHGIWHSKISALVEAHAGARDPRVSRWKTTCLSIPPRAELAYLGSGGSTREHAGQRSKHHAAVMPRDHTRRCLEWPAYGHDVRASDRSRTEDRGTDAPRSPTLHCAVIQTSGQPVRVAPAGFTPQRRRPTQRTRCDWPGQDRLGWIRPAGSRITRSYVPAAPQLYHAKRWGSLP